MSAPCATLCYPRPPGFPAENQNFRFAFASSTLREPAAPNRYCLSKFDNHMVATHCESSRIAPFARHCIVQKRIR